MKKSEINLCITAHNEGILSLISLNSVLEAKKYAKAYGINTIISLCIDSGNDKTIDLFREKNHEVDNLIFTNFRDQGLARNYLISESSSQYVGFMDADDLCSENWIVAAIEKLQSNNEPTIIHPEINWFFDNQNSILLNIEEDSAMFKREYYLQHNYFDALCIAPRKVWEEIPYHKRDLKKGYAYEDWLWNIETNLAGWKHKVAKNTIIFKRRRRKNSQNLAASRNNNTINFFDWGKFLN